MTMARTFRAAIERYREAVNLLADYVIDQGLWDSVCD